MADIKRISAVRNGGADFDVSEGASVQTYAPKTQDEKAVLYVKNTGEASVNVTIKAGDGIGTSPHGTSKAGDLVVSVGANKEKLIGPFDSMRFLNTAGENKGKILITLPQDAAAGIELAAIEL